MTTITAGFSLPNLLSLVASLKAAKASDGAIVAVLLQLAGASPSQVQMATGASDRSMRRHRSEVALVRSNLDTLYTNTTDTVSDLNSGSAPEKPETKAERVPEGTEPSQPPRPKRTKTASPPGQDCPPAAPIPVPVSPEADFLGRMYRGCIPGATVQQVAEAIMLPLMLYERLDDQTLHQLVSLAAHNTARRDEEVRAGRARWFGASAPLNWFAKVLSRMAVAIANRDRSAQERGAA